MVKIYQDSHAPNRKCDFQFGARHAHFEGFLHRGTLHKIEGTNEKKTKLKHEVRVENEVMRRRDGLIVRAMQVRNRMLKEYL